MNKKILETVTKMDYIVGCYDEKMNKLSAAMIKRICDNIGFGSTDIKVSINREPYVCEVCQCDDIGEVDFIIIGKEEYISNYDKYHYEELCEIYGGK